MELQALCFWIVRPSVRVDVRMCLRALAQTFFDRLVVDF